MKRTMLLLLVAVGLIAGCRQGNKQYTLAIQDAHDALCEGDPEKAERSLAKAEKIATKHKIQQTADARLLQAESKLVQGNLSDALNIAKEVLDDENTSPESTARAEEIVGKATLRQGDFDTAQDNFISAERGYESDEDKQRIADLIRLSRGLAAYSQGDIDVARKYWRTIKNADLRYSVDQNLQNAKTSDVN